MKDGGREDRVMKCQFIKIRQGSVNCRERASYKAGGCGAEVGEIYLTAA